MERRHFLTKAAAGTAALALTAACADDTKSAPAAGNGGAPAVQTGGEFVKWRMPSSFSKTLEVYESAIWFSNNLKGMTDGRFDIEVFPPGALMPAMDVLDQTQAGAVECCHTASHYYVGRDKTFAIPTALPFGMNTREMNAWMYWGEGQKLIDDFCGDYGVYYFLCGNTGAQMGGWFRKDIKTLDDMKGLKMRIAGISVDILSQLGMQSVQLPSGDILSSLERGDIDAAEWINPCEDEKLGLFNAVKNYYAPGWWENSSTFNFFVNRKAWDKLPKTYQDAFRVAAAETNSKLLASYDFMNPQALKRMVDAGVQIKEFPNAVLSAAYQVAQQVYADEAAKNTAFQKIYSDYDKFRREGNAWFKIAETRMDLFLQSVD